MSSESLAAVGEPVCEMRVLSGPQQGARVPVFLKTPLRVSHQLTGDVMLRSASGAGLEFSIEVLGREVAVRVVSGEVMVDGKALSHDEATRVPLGASLHVNGVEVSLCALHGTVLDDHLGDHLDVASEAEGSPPDGECLEQPVPPASTPDPLPQRLAWLRSGAVVRRSMLGGVSLIAASLSMWAVATVVAPTVSPQEKASKAEALLHARGWGDTRVEAVGGGQLAVLGVFPSAEDRTRASRVLAGEGLTAEMAASVEASVLEGVRELLRVKGVSAEAQETAPGHIRVNASVETKLAERMEKDLRADVSGLKSLEFINTPPKPVSRSPAIDDPGKRVVGVMPGKPAFVVTADGAKYFVGAMLPTGHRIRDIEGRSVRLDRDGQFSTLQF